jgi:hypothetical protein
MVFASVPKSDFVWTEGADKVKSIASSGFGHREFCGECGTPLLMKVDHQPETVDFSVATLDDPEAIAPGFHIFWGSRIGWFEPKDDLRRHRKFRPDTTGLHRTGVCRLLLPVAKQWGGGERMRAGGAPPPFRAALAGRS